MTSPDDQNEEDPDTLLTQAAALVERARAIADAREKSEDETRADDESASGRARRRANRRWGIPVVTAAAGAAGSWVWHQIRDHPATAALTLAAATASTTMITADTAPHYPPDAQPPAVETHAPPVPGPAQPDEDDGGEDPEDDPDDDDPEEERVAVDAVDEPGAGTAEDAPEQTGGTEERGPPDRRPVSPGEAGGRTAEPPEPGDSPPGDPGDPEGQPAREPQSGDPPQQQPEERSLACAEIRIDPAVDEEVCIP